jgi:hypothetical protein
MSAERFQKPTQRLRQILFSELQTRFPKITKARAGGPHDTTLTQHVLTECAHAV